MTLNDLLVLSSQVAAGHVKDSPEERLCYALQDLLAEGPPCGWELPRIVGVPGAIRGIEIPLSWAAVVSIDDARALARMLLRAAGEAEKENGNG